MKRLFLDANILVAVLNKEYPLFSHAARILSLADKPNVTLFTSPVCLSIAFYFVEKKSGNTVAREKIKLLFKHIQVCTVNHEMVKQTINNRLIHDFENGLEYYAAHLAGCHYIITENQEDFYFSDIDVKNCIAFLDIYTQP
ncbi:MAG: PIN domain-containing protein [Saprospiraceae bacterium]